MERLLSIRTALGTLLLLLFSGVAAAGPETHPFSVHDMLAMERISDPRVSPDGKQIAFVLRSTDLDANKGRLDLWLVGTDGQGLRRLTSHPAADHSPRWTSDAKLIFLSSRSGSMQVWTIDPKGGEATALSDLPLDVEDLVVPPAGERIVLAMEVYPDCRELGCTVKREEEEKARKATGRVYERLFVRHWDTWKDGRRRHIFSWLPREKEARDLMAGVDADCPSKPWGGMEEVAFSPDGRDLVYTARVAGREEAWSVDFNLYRVPLDGSQEAVCLTCDNKAWDTSPAYSPDGKTLAYLAMVRPGFEADRMRIRLLDLGSGKVRTLTEGWDRSARGILWSPDGRRIFTAADNLGQTSIFSIEISSGKVRTLVAQGNNHLPVVAGKRLIFEQDSLLSPRELFSVRFDGRKLRPVTRINTLRLARARMGQPEQFRFPGAKRDEVYGYLVRPVDFDPSRRYPVAFLVHGGPQGSFGNFFHYRWNPQAYAGAGYAVVMIDFHGSTGYGQAFQDAIRGDWGGAPYEDLVKGLDFALEQYPFLDGKRVCALGASYGGYMINWIAGQTDRFRCMVSHDGNLDERMAYFDTEELWFPEWEHRGTPWDNPEGYRRHNPIEHVAKWKTPMLVIHGALDYRVVDTQGLSAFTALQRRGIPSKLLYFPDENHWVLKPANSIQWHETVLGWLDQWLKLKE